MEEKFKNDLIKDIGQERYNHSLRVMEAAIDLAKKYNLSQDKARLAALLHDCGKLLDLDKLKSGEYFGIIEDIPTSIKLDIWHGFLGGEIAEKKYKVRDEDVLNSIRYHTTGRENMSALEKIIYLADYIEAGRSFPALDEIRKEAYINLDRAVLMAMENTIIFLIEKKKIIDLKTIEARNYLLNKNKF